MGKIAYIDLSNLKVQVETIPHELQRQFIGGRGINMYLLYTHTLPGINPLSPENILIVGVGLLTGVKGPSTSRCSISGKSPETGLIGDSNIGGYFAAELRKTGYDHLVISGQAENPVYILIENGSITINDASSIWGKDTIETTEILKREHGDSIQSLCIGQAGENLVRFACVRSGWKNTAARTGMGCLMGSKRVKAIVAKGTTEVPIKYADKFKEYSNSLNSKIASSKIRGVLNKYGTPYLFDLHNKLFGIVRTFNGQFNIFSEGANLSSFNLEKYYIGKRTCFSCSVCCRHGYLLKEGQFKGLYGEGPDYGMLGAFGPVCGIKNLETILVINDLLNRYGLDASSTGNIIAWAIELFKKGIIDEKDTGNLKLEWGDETTIIELIHQIATRKGFGDILANGAKNAAEKIGRDSGKYLIWVKNLPQSDPVDIRGHKGSALGVATSTRGADHLRSRPTFEFLRLSEDKLREIYGDEVSSDPDSYKGKARIVWWSENLYAVVDSLGICKFITKYFSPDLLGFEEFSKLIYYGTGIRMLEKELFEIGERITNIERMFLVREGIRREHDNLPSRYFQPMPLGKNRGKRINTQSFNNMLDEYYQLHGWDKRTGTPTKDTLKRLHLDKILDKICSVEV
ncbi:MAG: aldehyde ferredoxin oxidoreductase family protein [bacterium]